MKRILSIILAVVLSVAAITVGAQAKETLKVGINAEFPPFEYYEGEKLTGFDIDFMNTIAERIGYDIEYVDMAFDQLHSAVAEGMVDCAISAISITDERENVVDFTTPYISLGENENYAIVFPENYKLKAKLAAAAGESFVYSLVNETIKELIADSTVDKLAEKYDLSNFDIYEDTYSDNADELADEMSRNIPTEWAQEDIKKAAYFGITKSGEYYHYRSSITREEFCELVYSTIKSVLNKSYTINTSFKYEDTDSETAVVLNRLGIVKGKTETKFAPNDFLTREEAATIIVRMINTLFPMDVTEMWFDYDDMAEISPWASDSVQTISNLGFMNGVGENSFAPKDTYTTEQAIATLVRVCERAKASLGDDLGIIGGADGPTAIIVGENAISDEGYYKFCIKTFENQIKVDDFYIDEAIKLVKESCELAKDKEIIGLYTANEDITDKISVIGELDYSKPNGVFCIETDMDKLTSNLKAAAEAESVDIDFGKLEKITKRYNSNYLASLINSSYGAENLAALTILTNSRGYVMPKDFKNDFALYLQYDGDYSAIVSFSEYGDGVISANMSFVRNGDKDNMMRRLYEVASALGEDVVNVTKAVEK